VTRQTVEREIQKADELHRLHAHLLEVDPVFRELLSRYRDYIDETRRIMRASGMVAVCAACAREDAGGCCAEGVEGWYDARLLLLGRLLGGETPRRRRVAGGCLFLGEDGCRLQARYAFCVNYLCARLRSELPPGELAAFRRAAGAELYAGWEAERYLRRWLDRAPTG
jgi:hypothetical protein